jgi:CheY-like chemotaxis protein
VQLVTLWGYPVAVASDGEGVLRLLNEGLRPRAILLDLMMPEMSGWTVLELLRADARLCEIPVIVITAVADEELSRQPIRADAVLPKPINYDEQQILIRRLTGTADAESGSAAGERT